MHARFAYRGGNYTNASNAGLATLNAQNGRTNTSTTIGFRLASGIRDRSCVVMAAHPAPSRKDAWSSAIAEKAATWRADSTYGEPCAPLYTRKKMGKTVNGLFEGIVTFEALHCAYLDARRGKRRSLACMRFEQDLEGNLIHLQNELIWGEYRTGDYRYFEVTEPKRRQVAALVDFRDRVVHHALCTALRPVWEARFIGDSYACRVGKGTHAGAERAQQMMHEIVGRHGKLYALKADISKYFASIDHATLKRLIRRKVSDVRILALLDDIIDSYSEPGSPGKGLPLGNLTSQLFANIYLDALDQHVKTTHRERYYLRYMDDFVILHHDKQHLQALRISLQVWLGMHLQISTNHKTGVFPIAGRHGRGLDFLGYHLWPHRRRLRKASLKRFAKHLRRQQRAYSAGLISARQISERLASWTAHARHGQAVSALQSILNKYPFRRA